MAKTKKLMFGFSFKKFDNLDAFCFKIGIATAMLFLVSVWPQFAAWVMNVHWAWFLGIFVICWIRVLYKGWKK